ncbi:MAG: type II toxin-antitoxin system PemK/MazF family toxin [Bifidobacteriaceae bacterium]|jgi:mRNA interferase MazF|nr:type II toxin-antitoxin system PemK/MazF family toxin [Bifidobacteriaceae bacterium]
MSAASARSQAVTLRAGQIVWLYLDAAAGHEQKGRRPALVVSNSLFNEMSSTVMVCPITSSLRPFPLNVPLDGRTKTQGAVLCAQIRAFDLSVRAHKVVEAVPADILARCHEVIAAALGAETPDTGEE